LIAEWADAALDIYREPDFVICPGITRSGGQCNDKCRLLKITVIKDIADVVQDTAFGLW